MSIKRKSEDDIGKFLGKVGMAIKRKEIFDTVNDKNKYGR